MSKFADLSAATRFRDVVISIVKRTLAHERPPDAYGTVVTIDHTNRKCVVLLGGSTEAVTVSMGTIRPSAVGQTVRISGAAQDRYVSEVVQGPGYLDVGGLGAWSNYTFNVYQSVSITKTTYIARWTKIGRTVFGVCHFNTTSAGTAGNMMRVTLPPAPNPAWASNMPVGSGNLYTGSANVAIVVMITNSLEFAFLHDLPNNNYLGTQNVPVPQIGLATGQIIPTLANGWGLNFFYMYEAIA